MKSQVAIIDSGGANIASLQFALERLGANATLTTDANVIQSADRVILPGVGAAADAMSRLDDAQLTRVIPALQQPVLGICLGMQLLASRSDEHDTRCLGILPATASQLPGGRDWAVPNMGWCRVTKRRHHPLLEGIADGSWFYFVHSYALPVDEHAVASADHSISFAAIASVDNFHATQFHPERSASSGARLLQNFLAL